MTTYPDVTVVRPFERVRFGLALDGQLGAVLFDSAIVAEQVRAFLAPTVDLDVVALIPPARPTFRQEQP